MELPPFRNVRDEAADPLTSPARLDQLAQHPFKPPIRVLVASNPNASLETLWRLVEEFPAEVEANTALAFFELTSDASAEDERSLDHIRSVIANHTKDLNRLERYADDRSDAVRAAVAENPMVPTSLLTKLARDSEDYVRGNVAKNERTPPEALEGLASDGEMWVRRKVAAHPQATAAQLERLSEDPSSDIRAQVAAHPNTSLAIRLRLATDREDFVVYQLLASETVTEDVLAAAAHHPEWRVRERAAEHPMTSTATLERLKTDHTLFVRSAADQRLRFRGRR